MSLPAADGVFGAEHPMAAHPASQEPMGTGRTPSRRVRHEEKITVYVTPDELLDLEHIRLVLRREHGIAVDRGRIVRAAVTASLENFEAAGAGSELVRRLKDP
jgi:hypothetical protein